MEEKTKKILTYAIFPVVFTGIMAHSSFEIITGRKREEDPHIPEHNFPVVSFIRNTYMVSLDSSASVINTWEHYIQK